MLSTATRTSAGATMSAGMGMAIAPQPHYGLVDAVPSTVLLAKLGLQAIDRRRDIRRDFDRGRCDRCESDGDCVSRRGSYLNLLNCI